MTPRPPKLVEWLMRVSLGPDDRQAVLGDLHEECRIRAERNGLVIRAVAKPRAGWAATFQKMAERGEDALLDATPSLSDWDKDDWKW